MSWLDGARYFFNLTLGTLKNIEKAPHWMKMKEELIKNGPEWTRLIPFEIKAQAVKNAYDSFFKTLKSNKGKGKPAFFNFKSRKDSEKSCVIKKDAIKENGIYIRYSGKDSSIFSESLPEAVMVSRLVWKSGYFYLAVPYKTSRRVNEMLSENQARLVALDPGIRKFLTYYSEDSCGFLGMGDFSRIQRLCFYMDRLLSKSSKAGKQKKSSLLKSVIRMRIKIKNLVDELHKKVSLFLVKNYDVILLPSFETKKMSEKINRKINNKTVRNMLSFAFYRFNQFLNHKAFEYGKVVVDVCEAYTSKTHPQTGVIRNIGGSKTIKLLDGSFADRDIVGARNILLRALVDSPTNFKCAVDYC